jgi:outer membrane protein OmpA-like peptidoglycan-associated protein
MTGFQAEERVVQQIECRRRLFMRRFFILAVSIFCIGLPIASTQDEPGCSDHPLLSRMPNFYIDECQKEEFGEEEMYLAEDKSRMVEGKHTVIGYQIKDDAPRVSELQVKRNYTNAITKLGGKLVYEDRWSVFLKLEKGGSETWVHVRVFGGAEGYRLHFIEVEAMRQDVTASDMLKALNDQGFIALYINFDTDKAVIKPESQPVIDQIIALLQESPSLKVSIEGHTDNTGTPQHNKTLSEQRAQSVLNAVVKGGIGKERLSSRGWGQDKPMADNRTEEGKAKNRRVEIVKQ